MFASFDTCAHQALGEVATFLRRTSRGDCVWLLLTETCQGRAWQWGRGLNHWDSNQTLLGDGRADRSTGRSVPGTPMQAVLLRREQEKRWDRDK